MGNFDPKKVLSAYQRIAYVLQGGGALGAYQVGAYEIMHQHQIEPDWVVGTSIGAINGAIIVGNPPEKRLEKLHEFWHSITSPDFFGFGYQNCGPMLGYMHNLCGSQMALLCGQPHFFRPRLTNPWLLQDDTPDNISFYDTAPLRDTLERLIDFDLINRTDIVFKVGAVQVNTGRLKFFNNLRGVITPDHVMASCALPPGFGAIEIDGKYYWDGGVHSNTPLNMVLDAYPYKDTLCLMIDLFSSIGDLPSNMAEVLERKKDINFASHSRRTTNLYSTRQNLRRAINRLGDKLPDALKQDPEVQELLGLGCPATVDILHLIYDTPAESLFFKDYNFAQATIDRHLNAGIRDAEKAFEDTSWLSDPQLRHGANIYKAPNNPQEEEDLF